jgi:hypothetical protein
MLLSQSGVSVLATVFDAGATDLRDVLDLLETRAAEIREHLNTVHDTAVTAAGDADRERLAADQARLKAEHERDDAVQRATVAGKQRDAAVTARDEAEQREQDTLRAAEAAITTANERAAAAERVSGQAEGAARLALQQMNQATEELRGVRQVTDEQIGALNEQLKKLNGQLAQAGRDAADLSARTATAEGDVRRLRQELTQNRDELSRVDAERSAAVTTNEELNGQLQAARQQADDEASRAAELAGRLERATNAAAAAAAAAQRDRQGLQQRLDTETERRLDAERVRNAALGLRPADGTGSVDLTS